jgi:hypothetical protein
VTGAAGIFFTKHRNLSGVAGLGFHSDYAPVEHLKNTFVDVARGVVGNALAVPQLCPTVAAVVAGKCPKNSAVGGIRLDFGGGGALGTGGKFAASIYSIEPEFGTPAQFAFTTPGGATFTFVPRLRADEGYAISFEAAAAPERVNLLSARPTLCDFGLKALPEVGGDTLVLCYAPGEPGANPIPLITNPTRCAGPPPAYGLRINSWEHPGDFKTAGFVGPQVTECENVPFEPEVQLTPTNHQADTPTGLDVEVTMPTDGLEDPEGVSQANLDNVTVTFPKGMTLNPAAADGLGSCSLAQIKFHSNEPDECPESAKVGTVAIETPLIREPLTGAVFLAKQNDNPFNAPIGLYMDFASERDGVRIKVAGKLTPDPQTGQLISTFTENPEAPFSRVVLHFNSGPRAPLINPPSCGSYAIHSELSPWSAVNPANPTPEEIVAHDSTYEVSEGPNGGPCPAGNLEPKLRSGVQNNQAGSKSPFVLSLSREDGTQRFVGVSVTNPLGLTAYLKGIPYCPEGALAGVSGAEETGRPQIANPSCPQASLVGVASAGSGAGPFPLYVDTGRIYLAGPYKGAPLSLAVITPAVAGPFDLGNVLTRVALYINPETAQVRAVSDPIPTALHDIPLDVRDIRVALNRPNFVQAPTSCEPLSVNATVKGELGATANVSNRFQVGGCEKLGFGPRLNVRLFGGTHRGAHPSLRGTLEASPGEAAIGSAQVTIPRSEFLDQAHIRTVCTRVQFAANQCPEGSIYGQATATTPLLDYPVQGPVYLRSSDNKLPDLVVDLKGPAYQPIEAVVVGRVDSIKGQIRTSFEATPDVPLERFTLQMQGGKKGLLVNSRDICAKANRATVALEGHNGKAITLHPKLQDACGKGKKKHGHKRNHRHHRGR